MDLRSPTVKFATSQDGTSIAYRTRGQGETLIFSRGWITHLIQRDEDPKIRAFFARLEQHYRIVFYDGRGSGLSDRKLPETVTLDDLVADLAAVADATSPGAPFILWGSSWAGPTAVQYAAENSERVSSLILDGTFCYGPSLASPERAESFLTMIATARFQPEPVYASLSYMTDPEPGLSHQHIVERIRASILPDALLKLHELLYQMDVRDYLAGVLCPTLVLHRRGSRAVPIRAARDLAAGLPGSILAEFEGRSHNPWEGDAHQMMPALADFLGCPEIATRLDTENNARDVSLVYIDQVSSTDQMARLGDRRGVEVQARMIELLQHAAEPFGAESLSDTGDGIVFALSAPSEAVAAAQVIQRRVGMHNHDAVESEHISIRVGGHTGQVLAASSGRVSGLSIAYASRLCDLAGANQIVVSEVTKNSAQASIGSHDFTKLPSTRLKGLGEVTPYLVSW